MIGALVIYLLRLIVEVMTARLVLCGKDGFHGLFLGWLPFGFCRLRFDGGFFELLTAARIFGSLP